MGEAFTIEFYETAAGSPPVQEFLSSLSAKARQKCLSYIDLLAMMGLSLRASHIRKIEGDIWELRPEFGGTEYRIFFATYGNRCVLVHAVTKKRQKVARGDITLSQQRFNEWRGHHGSQDKL
jgi:phage-related protein